VNAGPDRELHDTLAPRRWRWAWLVLAYGALALGIIGIVVPGLPTTPFVLLAAFAAARGSRRMHDWLLAHRTFGPMIRDWERDGAISRRAKWTATILMGVCAVVMFAVTERIWLAGIGTMTMVVVALWMWRRPEPRVATAPERAER
jgi:uncharacterized membrane protein YbaN (DUF454 family)